MEFTELSEEELGKLKFANGRTRTGSNPYGALLEAVKSGKKIQVKLEEGKALKNLKWGLSQAAKKAELQIEIQVLADLSGVVVSMPTLAQPTQDEEGEPKPDAATVGSRSRK